MTRGFPTAEYQARLIAVQREMARAEIATLLLTTEPDVRYFSGFLTRFWESPARPWFLLIPASGAPVAVIPAIGADLMRQTWVTDIRTWVAPDLADDGVTLLAATLSDITPETGRIGTPMGHETHLRMPLADFERVKALVSSPFTDATDTIRRVREVKSPAEIAKIRASCDLAARAFDHVPEFARAGVPLDQVFRRFQIECLTEGADYVAYMAGGAGQGGYGDVISPASSSPLESGDILMIDTGAVRDGYFCDFDRNWAIGTANDASRRAYDTLTAATDAGLAAARAGATASDLYHAMNTVIGGKAGAGGRLGHGLGLQLTEWPSLIPSDHTVLRDGMVLTLEPGIEISPGKIMVFEENIVIRDGGAELITRRAPPHLPVLD
jgi:Xaa-Pro aminopeptidase